MQRNTECYDELGMPNSVLLCFKMLLQASDRMELWSGYSLFDVYVQQLNDQ